MSEKHSEARRFEPKDSLKFSQADVGPTPAPDLHVFGFFQIFGTFLFSSLAHRKRVINLYREYQVGIF